MDFHRFLFGFLSILTVAASAAAEPRVIPGEYVVEFKRDENSLGISSSRAGSLGGAFEVVKRGSKDSLLKSVSDNGAPYRAESDECHQIKSEDARVIRCSPNYIYSASRVSDDSKAGSLWGITKIEAPRAWDLTTGSDDVVIAVIDSGVDYNHPDLSANMWKNSGETQNGIDDDGNGVIDDLHGYNAVDGSGNPMDDHSHGTHVSGTIGGVGNNGQGVVGVSWNVKIMGIKFLTASGSGKLSDAIKAINYLIAMKRRGVNVRAVNNSWGGGGYSEVLESAIKNLDELGVIFVAAAGNEANDNDASPSYPASYEVSNVVSVAATDQNDNLAGFSNYGASTVHIAAPGVGILSTIPGGGYGTMSGTSMAAPHVAGVLGLLFAAHPNLSASDAIERIYATGSYVATLEGLVKGGRYVNVARAVYDERSGPQPTPVPNCSYTMRKIPFSPNREADNEPLLANGDELSFPAVAFGGQVFGQYKASLYASLNGVVYFDRAPGEMDYKVGKTAPKNSLAVLHADLAADEGKSAPDGRALGIRARVTGSGTLVIHWLMRHYSDQSSIVKLWSEFESGTGVIRTFVEYDKALSGALGTSSLAGISGASFSEVYKGKAPSGLGLEYTPVCAGVDNGGGVKVEKVVASREPKTALVRARGEGSGSVVLKAAINGEICDSSRSLNLVSGKGRARFKIPRRVLERGGRLLFDVAGAKDSLRVKPDRVVSRSLKRSEIQRACSTLLRKIRR